MELPKPPRTLMIERWAKSFGILLLGVAGCVTSFTTALALDTARDNANESQCRASLANETSKLEGQINVYGWTAALDLRGVEDEQQIQKRVDRLRELTDAWRAAQRRRDRANDICEE